MTRAQLDAIEQEMEQIGELEKLAIATDVLAGPAIYAQGPGSGNGDEDEDDDDDPEGENDSEADGGPGPEQEYSLE